MLMEQNLQNLKLVPSDTPEILSEDSTNRIFQQYLARLVALARTRISPQLKRRIDPEDLVMSAFRSFFIGARQGKWGTDGDLWSFLATITLRKAARQARQHQAARRSVAFEIDGYIETELVADRSPTSEEAVMLQDELEWLISWTDGLDREILLRQLRGDDPTMISQDLGISERSVRRSQQRVRELISHDRQHHRMAQEASLATTSTPLDSLLGVEPTVTLNDLQLSRYLGEGAHYKVFEGLQLKSGIPVVVKFLRKDSWGNLRAMKSCLREFQIISRIPHPNLERIIQWGRTSTGAVFLVSETTNAKDIREWLTIRRPLPQVVKMACDILSGLNTAHAAGVIHCDLKPENILMQESSGRYILIDFGMAHWREDESSSPGGTLGYLAPEQICPAFGEIGPWTDVYGFGALLYALLSGSPPYGVDYALGISRILSDEQPAPLPSDVPPEICDVIMTSLRKDSKSRWMNLETIKQKLLDAFKFSKNW